MALSITKLSVICPECHSSSPGERAQVGRRTVTLCFCNTCGVSWTHHEEGGPGTMSQCGDPERGQGVVGPRCPTSTDLLLGGLFADGYELVELATGHRVAAGLSTLKEVLSVARVHGGQLWQQPFDRFGRPLGGPIRVSLHEH